MLDEMRKVFGADQVRTRPGLANVDGLPGPLRPFYAQTDGLELPFMSIAPLSLIDESDRTSIPGWLRFGTFGYFHFLLCSTRGDTPPIDCWDHEGGSEPEGCYQSVVELITTQYEDVRDSGGEVTLFIKSIPDGLSSEDVADVLRDHELVDEEGLAAQLSELPAAVEIVGLEGALAARATLVRDGVVCSVLGLKAGSIMPPPTAEPAPSAGPAGHAAYVPGSESQGGGLVQRSLDPDEAAYLTETVIPALLPISDEEYCDCALSADRKDEPHGLVRMGNDVFECRGSGGVLVVVRHRLDGSLSASAHRTSERVSDLHHWLVHRSWSATRDPSQRQGFELQPRPALVAFVRALGHANRLADVVEACLPRGTREEAAWLESSAQTPLARGEPAAQYSDLLAALVEELRKALGGIVHPDTIERELVEDIACDVLGELPFPPQLASFDNADLEALREAFAADLESEAITVEHLRTAIGATLARWPAAKWGTQLVDITKTAIRQSLQRLFDEAGSVDDLAGYALCTDDGLETLLFAAISREALGAQDDPDLLFQPTEWPEQPHQEPFDAVNRYLQSEARAASELAVHVEQSFGALVRALAELKARGAFEPQVFLSVLSTDPCDQTEQLEATGIERLNDAAVVAKRRVFTEKWS